LLIARLLTVTLLVVLWVHASWAQTNLPNEMLREVHSDDHDHGDARVEGPSESNEAGLAPMYTAATPVSLPDPADTKRVKSRVVDKKFIVIMGALGGAESLRFTTHKLVLEHEFAAGAPWVTSVPPNQHLVAKYAAIYAAELLVAYELKKPHSWLPGDKVIRKFWWAYPAAMSVIHIKNGVGSIRTQPPSCPIELCQAQ
jgi:hypothetical protein